MARPGKEDQTNKKRKDLAATFSIGLLQVYQWLLSPWIGHQCRFHPSCSHYAIEAYETLGFFRGTWVTLNRLRKCHPWHEGGIDLVPAARTIKKEKYQTQGYEDHSQSSHPNE